MADSPDTSWRRIPRPGPTTARLLVNAGLLVFLVILFGLTSDKFLSAANVANVLDQISIVVTVGCFFTLLLVAGGIDLSVGGVLGVSAMVSVLLVNLGLPVPVAYAAGMCLGATIGLFNGFMVSVVGINTVIATLGTLYVTRGATQLLSSGRGVVARDPAYAFLGNGSLGPVPMLVVVMAIVLVIAWLMERRTAVGRFAVLVGSNPRGARLNGLPVRTVQVTLFVLTGAAAGLAGVMVASRHGSATPAFGTGFEFDVLIATLLGGTSLLGGEGTIVGLLLGALIVGTATTGMNMIGIASFVQTVLLGGVLIAAVGFDAVMRSRRGRPARRRAAKEPAA